MNISTLALMQHDLLRVTGRQSYQINEVEFKYYCTRCSGGEV